jgi:hypothetical protein
MSRSVVPLTVAAGAGPPTTRAAARGLAGRAIVRRPVAITGQPGHQIPDNKLPGTGTDRDSADPPFNNFVSNRRPIGISIRCMTRHRLERKK